jgi:hypothetical protein
VRALALVFDCYHLAMRGQALARPVLIINHVGL